jgi:hypothetical protein
MANNKNIPPVAEKVMCVDFDGTLFKWGDLKEKTPPFVGAVQALRDFSAAGWEIVIFTSRMSPTWWDHEGMDFKRASVQQSAFVKKRLDDFGIPFDRITAEKVPAEYYIDDKAIEFTGKTFSWNEIRNRILNG